jgi:hypothetical protein
MAVLKIKGFIVLVRIYPAVRRDLAPFRQPKKRAKKAPRKCGAFS